MSIEKKGSPSADRAGGCDIDIHIESDGDVNIYNCTTECKDKGHAPPSRDECKPPRADGACVPLGLGCKPKQSKRQKLEKLQKQNKVPSALAASFFQTGRRFLAGHQAANDFEQSVYPVFEGMSPEVRDILACAVENFESSPADIRNAGLDTTFTSDPDKPVDSKSLATAMINEIRQRASDLVFGNPLALEEERPGRNRFFEPEIGEEIFESQLRICRVNDLRTSSFLPPLTIGDYLPAEIQQTCELVQVGEDIQQNCSVQSFPCPGNLLPNDVCARVQEIETGDSVVISGVNFTNVDMKVRLTAKTLTVDVQVDAHVFGDLETELLEEVGGETRTIRDCRVKDRATFIVPDDLPPDTYELALEMPNNTGIAALGPTITSNREFVNIVPPPTARFQIVAERLRAREETSPSFPGSDEVALTVIASELFPDGTVGSPQILKRRFDDVDSNESRNMENVIFSHSQPIAGMAMSVVGYEVDSERAFRLQIESFEEAFLDYLERGWNKFKEELLSGGAGLIKLIGLKKGIIAIAVAAVVVIAIVAVVARWAPADLIIDDAIGFSPVELAELTNANAPSPGFGHFDSPQGLEINTTPLGKSALAYREFREYVADDEGSRYEIYYRYNRTA